MKPEPRPAALRPPKPSAGDAVPPLSPLPPKNAPLSGAWRFLLPVLLLAYVVLASAHAALAPTGGTGFQNAPDEAAHVTYVRVIGEGRLPTRNHPGIRPAPAVSLDSPEANRPSYEWHQPPLYYALDALLLPFGERGMRGLSIACGLVSLLFIFLTARRLFPNDPALAVVAVGVAALTPSHIAITSTVNNDALLEACFSATLFALANALRSGWTLYRAGWVGLALGLAILAKATGILLVPIILLALWFLRREGETPRNLLRGAAWAGLVALLVCGWWLVRNLTLYGEPIPVRAFNESFQGTAQASRIVGLLGGWGPYSLHVAQSVFRSFWVVFGDSKNAFATRNGIPLYLPDQLYLLLALTSLIALGGLTRLHLQRRTAFTPVQQHGIQLLFATSGLVALAFAAFLTHYYQTQGRYLYPAMLPIALLFALGWRAAFPSRYANGASGFLLLLLGASAVAYLGYIR